MPTRSQADLPSRRLIIGLAAFSALSALAGGVQLLGWFRGSPNNPIELLEGTPFSTFLIPGLLLVLVVGASSLWAAVAVARRSRWAIDAVLLAGGSLTIWILAEAALMRMLAGLQVVYGLLGLTILVLGVRAGLESKAPRHRWLIFVTAAEAIGFLAPTVAGVSTATSPELIQAATVVAAGLFEGLAFGLGQALAFPRKVRTRRYTLYSALGAGLVWASVMTAMGVGRSDVALGWVIGATAIASMVGLGAIGGAQWLELRHHVPRAHRWIAWTALAWAIALPLSFSPSPLVDESTSFFAHLILWGSGGCLMAYVMAQVTWQGVRRLFVPGPPASSSASS